MNSELLKLVVSGYRPSHAEACELFRSSPLPELMYEAHRLREKMHPGNIVTWITDRNVNITNVCVTQCRFCNFCRKPGHIDAYVTSMETYRQKIIELREMGGNQLLLQGGLNPALGLDDYCRLFSDLRNEFPGLQLHALGPPEIVFLSRQSGLNYRGVLSRLIDAGLSSLPGAGAEVLSDRVRKIISPSKCSAGEWLEVMRQAHKLGLVTSATMMFGHVETIGERIEHLILLRNLQDERPHGTPGFVSFIPWPFSHKGTRLHTQMGIKSNVTATDYLRWIAFSRLILQNIPHIQPSWLTVGVPLAQLCLHAGADDFGSVMIEENVVSSAGSRHHLDAGGLQRAVREAGFVPRQRNQKFEYL